MIKVMNNYELYHISDNVVRLNLYLNKMSIFHNYITPLHKIVFDIKILVKDAILTNYLFNIFFVESNDQFAKQIDARSTNSECVFGSIEQTNSLMFSTPKLLPLLGLERIGNVLKVLLKFNNKIYLTLKNWICETDNSLKLV